jgi:predicted protein tyrosine phosphatase
MFNRIAIAKHPYQGDAKKVLCVCLAGILRSPTLAHILSSPLFNYNTRACGNDSGVALIPLDWVLLEWADEIVCADEGNHAHVVDMLKDSSNPNKPVHCLHISDHFKYRQPGLVKDATDKLLKIYKI